MKISNIFLILAIPFWVMLVIETFWLPVDFFGFAYLLGIAIIIGIIFSLIRYTEKHGIGNPLDGGLGKATNKDARKAAKGFYDTVFPRRRGK